MSGALKIYLVLVIVETCMELFSVPEYIVSFFSRFSTQV